MVFGLLKQMDWEDVKSPLLFVSGMLVGFIVVALVWYCVQLRKINERKRREKEEEEEEAQRVAEEGDNNNDPTTLNNGGGGGAALIVADPAGDYLFEDKSQLGQVIDFKNVPRREIDRQQARRDFVITMLIAESMSK